ncbi:MAG TPA: hypothetical protein VIK01_22975 [Polyangiaceae bacterium]
MALRRHRSWSWITALALGGGAVQFGLMSNAQAEEDSAAETAAARTLAVDGLKLAQAGKCDEAIPKLDRAEKLHHSAIVLSRLGECEVSQGKLVEGTEMLRKVLREALPPNPSPALSKAYEHAQNTLDSAKPKIAGLTISVSAPQGTELHLTVDGQAVASTLLDSELPADPGDHVVEASATGFLKAASRVTLTTADKKTVTLKLEVDPNAPVPAVASATDDAKVGTAPPLAQNGAGPRAAVSTPPAPQQDPSHAAAYVSFGVGLVGVGVGSAFGLIALTDKHNLSGCTSNVCPASSRDSVDTAKRAGNISTIAFGVGGAGLLLGTVLYFSVGGSSETQAASHAHHGFAGLEHGRALVGPGSVQLAADF